MACGRRGHRRLGRGLVRAQRGLDRRRVRMMVIVVGLRLLLRLLLWLEEMGDDTYVAVSGDVCEWWWWGGLMTSGRR